MADVTKTLNLKIDPDTEEVKKLRAQLKGAKKDGQAAAKGISKSFKDAFKVLAAGALVNSIKNLFVTAVDESNKLEKALLGLEATARISGNSFDDLKNKVIAVADDGVISVERVTEQMKILIKQGFTADKAFTFLKAAKQVSAFNNIVGDTGQGVSDFIKFLQTGSAELAENLDPSLIKTIKSLGGYVKVSTDAAAKQALVNEVIRSGNELTQDYSKFLQSGAGAQSAFESASTKAAAALGDILKPALGSVLTSLTELVNSFTVFISGLSGAQKTILAISAGLTALIPIIGAAAIAFKALGLSLAGLGIITAVIAGIVAITSALIALTAEEEDNRSEGEKLADTYGRLAENTKRTAKEQEELVSITSKLKGRYAELFKETETYNNSLILQKGLLADLIDLEKLTVGQRIQSLVQRQADIEIAIQEAEQVLEERGELPRDPRFPGTATRVPTAAARPGRKVSGLTDAARRAISEANIQRQRSLELETDALKEALALQKQRLQLTKDQITAENKVKSNLSAGAKVLKKRSVIRTAEEEKLKDNLFTLNDFEKTLSNIKDEFEAQLAFLDQELETASAIEKVLLLQRRRAAEIKKVILDVNVGLGRVQTTTEGVRDTLLAIKDKAIGGIISGLGKITGAFNSALGQTIGLIGTIVSTVGEIFSLLTDEEEQQRKIEERIRKQEEAEQRKVELLRQQLIAYKLILDIQDAIRDAVVGQVEGQLRLNELFIDNPLEKAAADIEAIKTGIEGLLTPETKAALGQAGVAREAEVTTKAGLQAAITGAGINALDQVVVATITDLLREAGGDPTSAELRNIVEAINSVIGDVSPGTAQFLTDLNLSVQKSIDAKAAVSRLKGEELEARKLVESGARGGTLATFQRRLREKREEKQEAERREEELKDLIQAGIPGLEEFGLELGENVERLNQVIQTGFDLVAAEARLAELEAEEVLTNLKDLISDKDRQLEANQDILQTEAERRTAAEAETRSVIEQLKRATGFEGINLTTPEGLQRLVDALNESTPGFDRDALELLLSQVKSLRDIADSNDEIRKNTAKLDVITDRQISFLDISRRGVVDRGFFGQLDTDAEVKLPDAVASFALTAKEQKTVDEQTAADIAILVTQGATQISLLRQIRNINTQTSQNVLNRANDFANQKVG